MFKRYFKIGFVCSIIFFTSCSDRDETYSIINQNFISIIDTVAYDYYTLRPAPNMPRLKKRSEYAVSVYNKFADIHLWEKSIVEVLKKDTLKENQNFIDLFKSSSKEASTQFDIKKINQTGLYHLYPTDSDDGVKQENSVGYIKFSDVIYNDEWGMMVVTIQDDIKSGFEELILFKKEKGRWTIINKNQLSVW